MTMHVCLLHAGDVSSNPRAMRAASALRAAGHAVTVCARGTTGDPDREIVDGIEVRRLPDESLYTGLRGKLDGARYALQYVHPAWVRAASDVDDERAVDACCVADRSLVKTGLRVGENLDVPVVCDLPSATLATNATPESRGGRLRGVARRVFHSAWRRNRLVTKSLPDADRLVTTPEEARAEYVRAKGLDPRRVAVVRDTADANLASDADTDRHDRDLGLGFDPDEAFVVTAFVENASNADRETLVEAAARAADETVDLRVVVVGALSRDALDDLETLARRRLAGGRVTFRTEVDTDRTADYVAASDVCVFPRDSRAAETAVPPVVYEAMALGVPVVASETPPLRRLVGGTNAGRVVTHGMNALADVLVELSNPDTAAVLGDNGRRAVERGVNRERDTDRLLAVYESLDGDVERDSSSAVRTDPPAGS